MLSISPGDTNARSAGQVPSVHGGVSQLGLAGGGWSTRGACIAGRAITAGARNVFDRDPPLPNYGVVYEQGQHEIYGRVPYLRFEMDF